MFNGFFKSPHVLKYVTTGMIINQHNFILVMLSLYWLKNPFICPLKVNMRATLAYWDTAPRNVRRQGKKFSPYLTTNVKLGTSGRWVGTQAGAGVTTTLV